MILPHNFYAIVVSTLNPLEGYSTKGTDAIFVPLNEDEGVKLYANDQRRDLAFVNQDLLAADRLAPGCGHKFTHTFDHCEDFFCPRGHGPDAYDGIHYGEQTHLRGTYHGYWTERAEVGDGHLYEAHAKRVNQARPGLMMSLNARGWHFSDTHPGNIGFMPDGRPVVVDTGEPMLAYSTYEEMGFFPPKHLTIEG